MPNSEKVASHVGLICHHDKNGLALIPSHVSSNISEHQLPMHISANNAFHYQLAGTYPRKNNVLKNDPSKMIGFSA